MAVNRTSSFDLAYQFVTETYLNVFLTGKAGTGKTTFLKYLKANSNRNIVVAAPTGVAAINAQGVTLHSLFQLPFSPFVPSKNELENTLSRHPILSQIRLNNKKRKILRNMDLLVIDEVSMVASYVLDAIDIILKSVRRNYNHPFGGVQVLFIGDMHQLPPVVKREQRQLMGGIYTSEFFFDALVLKQYPPVMVELKKVFRQSDDVFIDILNGIRNNNLKQHDLDILNKRINPNIFNQSSEGYITLTTHNNQSDLINENKLGELKEKPVAFDAVIKDDFPENIYPADGTLLLKEGAQVMFLRNDQEKRYFNGKIGVVAKLNAQTVWVKCEGEDLIEVEPEVWQNINYNVDKETRAVEEEVVGTFTQLPLRLAWAITIHKSQGLTFDKLIVDAERAFANGQTYVALSRCTSLEGLVLTAPISTRFLGASQNLKLWERDHNKEDLLPERLKTSRVDFIQYELLQTFSWGEWVRQMRTFDQKVQELRDQVNPEIVGWSNALFQKLIDFNTVAQKFQNSIKKLICHPDFINDSKPLQKRLQDAGTYFYPLIDAWWQDLKAHNIVLETKQNTTVLDEALEEMNLFLHDLVFRIDYFSKGEFQLTEYLIEGKFNRTEIAKINSTYQGKTSKSRNLIAAGDIEHIGLYQMIAEYRGAKAKEAGIPLYRVFNNESIKGLCSLLPNTPEQLKNVKGLGPAKIGMYGNDILELINTYRSEEHIPPKDLFS